MHNHLADRFDLMCAQLARLPIPDPPAMPGRIFAQSMNPKDAADDFAAQWTNPDGQRQENSNAWLARRSASGLF